MSLNTFSRAPRRDFKSDLHCIPSFIGSSNSNGAHQSFDLSQEVSNVSHDRNSSTERRLWAPVGVRRTRFRRCRTRFIARYAWRFEVQQDRGMRCRESASRKGDFRLGQARPTLWHFRKYLNLLWRAVRCFQMPAARFPQLEALDAVHVAELVKPRR